MSEEQIEHLLDEDLDQLFERFGEELEKQRFGAHPTRKEERIANGRHWIDQKREDICRVLKKDPRLVAYVCDKTKSGRIEVISAIIDALSALASGTPLVTLSVIIFKQGIHELCPDFCKKDG